MHSMGLIGRLSERLFPGGPSDPARKVLPETPVPQDERDIRMAAREIEAKR